MISRKVILTVFTPTYNRCGTLCRTYKGMLSQTNKNFIWQIIDDGSTDNTRETVAKWMNNDNGFEIKYYQKGNGGLHTAYNKAIELADTELIVCIDSDDYMPSTAVDDIITYWESEKEEQIAGFIGLDFNILTNKPIGGWFPQNVKCIHWMELELKLHHYGDVKVVFRTDLLKQVAPQPTINGEKNFNPVYMTYLIDRYYVFKLCNKNLCIVDYQSDGMSRNIYNQYYNSPNSFAALRLVSMSAPGINLYKRITIHIHYVAEMLLAKKADKIFNAKELAKAILIVSLIPGWLLSLYIRFMVKCNRKYNFEAWQSK